MLFSRNRFLLLLGVDEKVIRENIWGKRKQKDFKGENINNDDIVEDEDMPRVRGHYRRICGRGRRCRRVRVRAHRRRLPTTRRRLYR